MSKKKTTTKKKTTKPSSPASPQPSGFPALAQAVQPAGEPPQPVAVAELPPATEPAPTPAEVAVAELPPAEPVYTPDPQAKMPDPAEHREPPFDNPDPLGVGAPPVALSMEDHITETVEPLAAVEPVLGDFDHHPVIKLPMCLIRDKKRMVRYAQALGTNPVEAQSRREKLKLTPQIMFLFRHYKKYCEKHGMRYWTERGFAATLVCFYRGVPLEEPEQEGEQDIIGRISEGVTREQARK